MVQSVRAIVILCRSHSAAVDPDHSGHLEQLQTSTIRLKAGSDAKYTLKLTVVECFRRGPAAIWTPKCSTACALVCVDACWTLQLPPLQCCVPLDRPTPQARPPWKVMRSRVQVRRARSFGVLTGCERRLASGIAQSQTYRVCVHRCNRISSGAIGTVGGCRPASPRTALRPSDHPAKRTAGSPTHDQERDAGRKAFGKGIVRLRSRNDDYSCVAH